jgi:cobalamin biosynthetic protein CobC
VRFSQRVSGSPGLQHGGQLSAAAQHYGIAEADWLDLSTGINPLGWPVTDIPARVWQRLPENDQRLEQAASDYYRSGTASDEILAVSGSQAAIQLLPELRPASRVGFLSPGYAEHPHAWQRHGHQLQQLTAAQLDAAIEQLDVVLLCRPNNPDGTVIPRAQLLRWQASLLRRGGWLIVDEAFADADPDDSIADLAGSPGLIILRSLGKFFGLAGLRLGFVLAEPTLLMRLAERLGPWSVSHPARWLGERALADRQWQTQARQQLQQARQRLDQLLAQSDLQPAGGSALFRWLPLPDAAELQQRLAEQAILVRRFDQPTALRFGLPGAEAEWQQLERALYAINQP